MKPVDVLITTYQDSVEGPANLKTNSSLGYKDLKACKAETVTSVLPSAMSVN